MKKKSLELKQTNPNQRIQKLRTLENEILNHADQIRAALSADFQKPVLETNFTEIFISLHELRHAIKNLSKWMRPRRVKRTLLTATAKAEIHMQPKGVVLIIAPWNFPINLTLTPLISAIAAGNCAVIKPSEFAPNSAQVIADIVNAVFPEDEVAVVHGDKLVAEHLLQQPFDHIFFTGSPEVGKLVMKAAADQHASVTLELGGKSPVIIDETADLHDAAQKLSIGKFLNCGQTCIAPDYLLLQESIREEFIDIFKTVIEKSYGKNGQIQKSPHFARIISPTHYERVKSLLETSRAQGAEIIFGGQCDTESRFIAPTLLAPIAPDSPILQEEIFGPLLPIIPFTEITDAIGFINQKPKPLALYVFSNEKSNIQKILVATSSGGITVNDFAVHYLQFNLPFGGTGKSGFGSAHGFAGFRTFSHERAVAFHHRWSAVKLFAAPFTKFKLGLTKLLIKYL